MLSVLIRCLKIVANLRYSLKVNKLYPTHPCLLRTYSILHSLRLKTFFLLLFFKTSGGSCVIFIQLSYTLLVISADTRGRRFTLKGLKGDSVTRFFNSIYFPQVCQKNLAGVPFSVDDRKQIMCTEDYQK